MKRVCLLVLLLCSATLCLAQTGIPLWGSFERSAFDTINLQNLNANFNIPIVSAPSRGEAFNYSLIYDSLIWSKTGNAWTPVADDSGSPTWGWKNNQALGSIHHLQTNAACDTEPPTFTPHFFGYTYTDGNGTIHKFSVDFYHTATACEFNTGPKTGYSIDGSGYFLDATSGSPVVLSPSGKKVSGTTTDENGNYVSAVVVNSSETDFQDTNGRSTLKDIKNSNTSRTYAILDQTGSYSNASVNVTYTSFNVKTHFACSGVTEYTGSGIYLITQITLPTGQSYSFTYEPTPGFSGYVTARVKTITLPTGGLYEYDYPTTGNNGIYCADATVISLTRTISDSGPHSWQFQRSGTIFNATTVTAPTLPYDPTGNMSIYVFVNSLVTSQKIYQGSIGGNPLREITTSYASNGTPAITTTKFYGPVTTTKVETDFDSNANLTARREYAWGTSVPGALVRTTAVSYLTGSAYTTANILDRVQQILVKDSLNAIKQRIDISYDNYGTGNSNMNCVTGAIQHIDGSYGCSFSARGNPTSITRYTDAATPSGGIVTNLYYDSLGNIRKTDVNGAIQSQVTFSSGTQYAFPDSITNGPLGTQLTTSATYNGNTGLLATSTDANAQITTYTYDNLRRKTDLQRPDSAHITYAYDDTNNKITLTSPVQGSDVVHRINYLDALGRVNKTAVTDVSNATYSIVQTQFDPLGRAYRVSNPHNGTAQYWTEADNDALGRITKQILPDSNQTTYAYSGSTVTITDPAGQQKMENIDALGRLTTAYEPDVTSSNALTVTTSYAYDVLDRLTQVTQGTQTRAYINDSLGRASSVTFPETGQIQYLYNAFDQVTQRTDARGVITTYSYDGLNRPYQKIYNVGATGVPATPTVTHTYGTTPAQFNNGRLITVATSGVETDTLTYDQLGRTTTVSKNITGAKTYNIGYGYNLAGEVTTLTYPSNRVVTEAYDAIGRLSQTGDGTPRVYANQFSYNPAQEVLGYTAGNGVQGTFGYSPSRLQLATLSYAKGVNTLLSLSYGYAQPNGGNNGQITAITDNLTAANSLAFTYDALGRLTRGKVANLTVPNSWDISWGYDRYGNRTSQTETGGTLGVTNTNVTFSNNRLTGGFAYDVSGNMTDDAVTHNYSYDAENRFVKLGATAANVYDGSGLRIEKTGAGTTTVYIFSGVRVIAEYTPSAATSAPGKEYIYCGSQVLATLDSSHIPTYRQPDHLSARIFTDTNGNVVGTQGNLPFGDSWYSSGIANKWRFTSYERDGAVGETGLDYAMMRFDNTRFGRFMSSDADSGSAIQSDPQSLNRYLYVTNDPVNLVDPSGLQAKKHNQRPPKYSFPTCSPTSGEEWSSGGSCDGGWDEFELMNIPVTTDEWGWNRVTSGTTGFSGMYHEEPGDITNLAYWGPIQVGTGLDLLSGFCALYCGKDGNRIFNNLYPDPNVGVIRAPTPRTPSSGLYGYVEFLGCEYASVVETITDEEDGEGWTAYGFINAGAILALRSGAGATTVGLVFVGTAAVMDTAAMLKANKECTEQIYH